MNKDIMRKMGFAKEVEAVEKGECPFCHQPVRDEDFHDDLSRKEFRISGMCARCQDSIFS